MLKVKICRNCKKEFNNVRGDGYFLGDTQFSKRESCSKICSRKLAFEPNEIISEPNNMSHLWLENKKNCALFDSEHTEKVKKLRWHLDSVGYPTSYLGRKIIRLHQFIMGKRHGLEIDHINRNKLDNRKENLRFVTHKENIFNSPVGDRHDRKCTICGEKHVSRGFCKIHYFQWKVSDPQRHHKMLLRRRELRKLG